MVSTAKSLLVALVLFASPFTKASTFATDASDLWYNAPAESQSGWGVNVSQQGDTLFITMFVYGGNQLPTWFVASNVAFTGVTSGVINYSGPLYVTGGSSFSGAWNPGAFTFRQVGNVTFSLTSVTTATLNYTVDGSPIAKTLVRQTWKNNDLTGNYMGGQIGTYSNCVSAPLNGYVEEAGLVAVTHAGSNISIVSAPAGGGACTFSGSYVQAGRMGTINGTLSCTNGASGTFSANEIEGGLSGFTARVVAVTNVCNWSGRVGGLRRGP